MVTQSSKRHFRDRLKILMGKERPYTFAKKVGIEKGLFQYYWQKGKIPTYKQIEKLCDYSGCTMEWILTGKEVDFSKLSLLPAGKDPKSVRLGKTMKKLEQIYRTKDDKTIDGLEFPVDTVHKKKYT